MPVDVRAVGLFGVHFSERFFRLPALHWNFWPSRTVWVAVVPYDLFFHGHARCGEGGENAQLAPAGAAVHGDTNSMYVSSDSNVWHGFR